CQSCGQIRIDIGADRSEQLDYRPASLFVVEHFVHKYVCPCCSRRPAHAQVQQIPPDQESEPMPERPSESQPPPLAPEGRPTPGPMDTPPEQVTPSQQPTEPGHRSPAPTPLCRLPDPSEVVIAAPKPAMPIAKGLRGPGLLAHLIVSKY